MKRIILLLSIIFFASSSFAADSVPVPGLSLEECLTIAITNHLSLRKTVEFLLKEDSNEDSTHE